MHIHEGLEKNRMSSRPLRTVMFLAAATLVTACAGAPAEEAEPEAGDGFPVEVTSCGFTSTVAAKPQQAVTMNQGATEIALALGVEDQLAGTAYLDDAVAPQWQEAYDSVDVLAEEYPDQETLLDVSPDLVVGSYASAFDDDAAGSRETLEETGIASYLSPFGCEEAGVKSEASFDNVWLEIEGVAQAFGVAERAAEIEAEQQQTLDELAEEQAGEGLDVFWFDSGDKTAFAGTGQGGPQLILDAVGATNVFADLDGGWQDVAWEKVVATDPDVIVLADASWSTAKEKIELLEKDPVLSELQAVKDQAYVTIPFSESTPGVRLADGAASVAEQLAALD